MARFQMIYLLMLIMGIKTMHSEEVEDSELENDPICGADSEVKRKRGTPFRTFTNLEKDKLWDSAVVPWAFASIDNAKNAVHIDENVGLDKKDLDTTRAAMRQIEERTCIKFKEEKPVRNKPWLFIYREARSSDLSCQRSYAQDNLVGKNIKGLGNIYKQLYKRKKKKDCTGGGYAFYGSESPQSLVISSTRLYPNRQQSIGFMIHELLHVLGVGHTQKRQDADENIEIKWENIKTKSHSQYEPEDSSRYDTHGTRYNCMSIMHYRDTTWRTEKGKKTMVAIKPEECDLSSINRNLTDTDVKILKQMYCVNNPIISPNYPENYPNKNDTKYSISVEEGHVVSLQFTAFNIEFESTCSYDWVQVLDGDGTMLLKKSCGNEIPDKIESRTNKIVIKFHSDDSKTYSGFKAEYEAISTKRSGEVTSPGYPSKYANNQATNETISVPLGSRIELRITDLSIEAEQGLEGNKCLYDRLNIFDGDDQDGDLLETLCGSTVPVNPVLSAQNAMTLVFTADESVNFNGFRATWREI